MVRGSKKGDDQREATLQLCVRLTDDSEIGQPYPVLIFRGQGKWITQQEKDAWEDRVEVKFQPKAWADEPFNLWYAQECFPLFVEDGESNVLFLDNLGTQATDEVLQGYKTMANTEVHFLPSDTTDSIQPIDAGIGLRVKQKIREEHEKWMEEDQNLSKWVNGQVKAWERRVLITRWTGAACANLLEEDEISFEKIGLKTGCLMTADGSEDALIRPQGTEQYTFCDADGGSEGDESEDGDQQGFDEFLLDLEVLHIDSADNDNSE